MKTGNVLLILLALCSAGGLTLGCGAAQEGAEGQPCRPDGSCDAGLSCNASSICEAGKWTRLYQSASFQKCAGCHAPGAAGFVNGTEATQDWSSQGTAYTKLKGNASGLIGNFVACNGVPFLGATPATSLLVAVFDQTVRGSFTSGDCNVDTISDMTLKIGGALEAGELALLKEWITAGTPND
jgi:hypothetical protein